MNDAINVIGQEFEKVVMVLDDYFYYDDNGILQASVHPYNNYLLIQLLFQGMTRTRTELTLVVVENVKLFKKALTIFS